MGFPRRLPFGALLFAIGFTLVACEGDTPSEPVDPKGSLRITVEGLPSGVDAAVTVEGPGAYSTVVTETTTLGGLTPGAYDITVGTVSGASSSYTSFPASYYRVVNADATTTLAVSYAESDADNNLWIEGMYVAQVVQRFDGSVPLIANQDALLRVFVRASKTEVISPSVRVSFYDGPDLVDTVDIAAPGLTVATQIDESNLDSSWNLLLTPQQVAPGLRILAEIDAENAVLETDETDNRFPENGTPFSPDVRALAPLRMRFVPVFQSSTGLTGSVNIPGLMDPVDRMLPTAGSQSDTRAVYTTSQPALMSMDENGAWGGLLSELWTLRASEDPGTRHWYGVVDVNYGAGIAGIAYVGDFTGLGRQLDSAVFAEILPHELGHNLGRQHSACGTQGQHQDYPHANGRIGVWGYDLEADDMFAPTTPDVMGYCSGVWISDYTYERAFDHRDGYAKAAQPAPSTSCLMVWGRIDSRGLVLEPAFRVDAAPRWPEGSGPNSIEVRAADGALLYRSEFAGHAVADLPNGPQTHFAFLLPLDGEAASISLQTPTGGVVSESIAGKQAPHPRTLRTSGGFRLEWDATSHPMALVRDADTGEILSFARGGTVELQTDCARVEVQLSDGVRSEARMITIE